MKVLVVDDDQKMVMLIGLLLKVNGHEAIEAFGGREGIDAARKEIPDIVLLDIMMPDMDGFDVLRELRSDRLTENIPVVFVTARNDAESRKKALSLGSQGYLAKPYGRNELIETINSVVYASQNRQTPVSHSVCL
jgi:two-component system alkaline phosphatase synthesis response regulator PhoP